VKSHAHYRSLIVEQHRRQLREDARRQRLAASVSRRTQRRDVRRTVGRSLIRLGQYVSPEVELHPRPARSR
jgi:hypothetical protein